MFPSAQGCFVLYQLNSVINRKKLIKIMKVKEPRESYQMLIRHIRENSDFMGQRLGEKNEKKKRLHMFTATVVNEVGNACEASSTKV